MFWIRSSARAFALCLAFLFTPALAAVVRADVGAVDFTLGYKQLSPDWVVGAPQIGAAGDTLAPDDPSQPGLGIETSWGRQGWPVWLAFDVMHTYDDGVQVYPPINVGIGIIPRAAVRRRASTLELGAGVRRQWTVLNAWAPYLGAGGSWVRATVIDDVIDPAQGDFGTVVLSQRGNDSAIGWWVGGGLMRRVGPRFRFGLTARYTSARVTLPETRVLGELPYYRFTGVQREVEAGGRHIGLVLGWAFPGR